MWKFQAKHKVQKQEKYKPASTKIEKYFALVLKTKIKIHTSLNLVRNVICPKEHMNLAEKHHLCF